MSIIEIATDFATELNLKMSNTKFDYEPARLVERDGDKRWYIEFKAWNNVDNKLQRKHIMLPTKLKTVPERRAWAKERIKKINALLASGFHFGEAESNKQTAKKMSVQKAFQIVLEAKRTEKEKDTFHKYQQIYNHFLAFLEAIKQEDLLTKNITEFSEQHAVEFYHYINQKTDIQKSTKFNIKTIFRYFFSHLVKNKILKENPAPYTEKLKGKSSKNKAFTMKQLGAILTAAKEYNFQLYVFLNMMFYTFARPGKELRFLKIEDVDFEREKIKVRSELSKNDNERRIDISPHLMDVLKEIDLHKYPRHFYIFGKNNEPAPEPMGENTMYSRFMKLLESLKITDPDLTLYSVKHTGITEHYLAGIEVADLMAQSGHEDYDSFMTYLKSLNLIENTRFKAKSPKIGQ